MNGTKPYNFIGFGAMDVTKPYAYIGFGAMDVTTPYAFTWFGAMDVAKSYEIIGFGAMPVTKPCEFIRFGAMDLTQDAGLLLNSFFPNSVSLEGSNGGKEESLRMTPQVGPAAALAAVPAAAFAAPVYRDSPSFAHPEGSKLKEAICQIAIFLRPRLRLRLLSTVIRVHLPTRKALN